MAGPPPGSSSSLALDDGLETSEGWLMAGSGPGPTELPLCPRVSLRGVASPTAASGQPCPLLQGSRAGGPRELGKSRTCPGSLPGLTCHTPPGPPHLGQGSGHVSSSSWTSCMSRKDLGEEQLWTVCFPHRPRERSPLTHWQVPAIQPQKNRRLQ